MTRPAAATPLRNRPLRPAASAKPSRSRELRPASDQRPANNQHHAHMSRGARNQRTIVNRWGKVGHGLKLMAISMVLSVVAAVLGAVASLSTGPTIGVGLAGIISLCAGVMYLGGFFGLFHAPERRTLRLFKASFWIFLLAGALAVAGEIAESGALLTLGMACIVISNVLFWMMVARIGRAVERPVVATLSIIAMVVSVLVMVLPIYLGIMLWSAQSGGSIWTMLGAYQLLQSWEMVSGLTQAGFYVLATVTLFMTAAAAKQMASQPRFRARPVPADPDDRVDARYADADGTRPSGGISAGPGGRHG